MAAWRWPRDVLRGHTTWMMNMMNRFVEGRGHQWGIDILLEITYSDHFHLFHSYQPNSHVENKSKGERFVRLEMPPLGPYKV